MICPRCHNDNPQYFGEIDGRKYCRKCIGLGRSASIIQQHYLPSHIDYHLDYALTHEQLDMSFQLLQRYKQHQNTVIKAVCGAGKTEIIYEVLKYAINSGHKVCLTMPRRELVIEIAQRIKRQFSHLEPVLVYGGHCQKIDGQFIICTTHQLYRYRHCFDLLILDEFDAFPYQGNDVLSQVLLTSIKGQYIFMSATTSHGDLQMNKRYHGGSLPVPKCIVTTHVIMYILLILRLKQYRKCKKPVLVFVPKIQHTQKIVCVLKLFHIKAMSAHSQSFDIRSSLSKLKNQQLDVLVCTTILERGITIANVQVIVLYSEHAVFQKETLIQIAGRVGRSIPYIDGDVIFYTCFKTKAIKQCILEIKQDNA